MAKTHNGVDVPRDTEDFIKDNEVLLRRCPNKPPSFVTPRDLVTGRPKIDRAALRIDEGEDGLSVYRQELLKNEGLEAECVRTRDDQYVFGFEAQVVRRTDWEAFYDPQSGGMIYDFSHSLVALEHPFSFRKADHKEQLALLRAEIIAAAEAIVIPAA